MFCKNYSKNYFFLIFFLSSIFAFFLPKALSSTKISSFSGTVPFSCQMTTLGSEVITMSATPFSSIYILQGTSNEIQIQGNGNANLMVDLVEISAPPRGSGSSSVEAYQLNASATIAGRPTFSLFHNSWGTFTNTRSVELDFIQPISLSINLEVFTLPNPGNYEFQAILTCLAG